MHFRGGLFLAFLVLCGAESDSPATLFTESLRSYRDATVATNYLPRVVERGGDGGPDPRLSRVVEVWQRLSDLGHDDARSRTAARNESPFINCFHLMFVLSQEQPWCLAEPQQRRGERCRVVQGGHRVIEPHAGNDQPRQHVRKRSRRHSR